MRPLDYWHPTPPKETPEETVIHEVNKELALFLVLSIQAFDLEKLARSLR